MQESDKVSVASSTEIEVLSEQIKQLVKGLEYSDKVAEDFAPMVIIWKDEQGGAALVAWKQKLNQARQDYKQGKVSKGQLAKIEENIVRQLSQRIQEEIGADVSEKLFDLGDVIKHRQAQCVGFSQLFYVLGNSVGLSVKTINVAELMVPGPLPAGYGHMACTIGLPDSKVIMIDLYYVFPKLLISTPFIIEKEFTKVGNYWELKDKENPLGIHRRIQILDKKGLIAAIYTERGTAYANQGQFTKAISDYNRAIELNPKYAEAYTNRGLAHRMLGQLTKAISDYNKAIQLNPKYAEAYSNRGVAYDKLGQLTKAISEFNKAIKLNPKLAEAYSNRGLAYFNLGQFTKAISDYTKAIKLNPKYVAAYSNRGNAYGTLGQFTKAISDYTKAIEVNPKYAKAYGGRGLSYAFLGKSERAKKDLLKAVELDPASKPHVKAISDDFKLNLKLDSY